MSTPVALQTNLFEIHEELRLFLLALEEQIQAANQYSSETLSRFKEKLGEYFGEWQQIRSRTWDVLQSLPREIRHREISKDLKQALEKCESSLKTWYAQIAPLQFLEGPSGLKTGRDEAVLYLKKMWQSAGQLVSPLGSLQDHPVVKRFLAGETVLASRSQLQWPRKIFHASLGLFGMWFYGYSGVSEAKVLGVLLICLSVVFGIESGRRLFPAFNQKIFRVLSPLMREREKNKIASSTWFMCAILLVILLFPKPVGILALFYTSVGDPVAGIVGAHWGRHKLAPHVSLEGSLAAFLVCFLGTLLLCHHGMDTYSLHGWSAMGLSLLAAVAATLAECSFKNIDDNLTIPLLTSPVIWLLMKLFH